MYIYIYNISVGIFVLLSIISKLFCGELFETLRFDWQFYYQSNQQFLQQIFKFIFLRQF